MLWSGRGSALRRGLGRMQAARGYVPQRLCCGQEESHPPVSGGWAGSAFVLPVLASWHAGALGM